MTHDVRLGAPLDMLLDSIAARSPTPGGGAVAAWLGATGAALGLMVVAYSIGRRAEHDEALEADRAALENARLMFMELAEEDAAAYAGLAAALKLDKNDPARADALEPAVRRAVDVPSAVAATGLNVLRLMEDLAERVNPYLRSDLGVAAGTIEAGIRGAVWMVRANVPLLGEGGADIAETAGAWVAQAGSARSRIDEHCG